LRHKVRLRGLERQHQVQSAQADFVAQRALQPRLQSLVTESAPIEYSIGALFLCFASVLVERKSSLRVCNE
jgi:hypothetical protein